MLEVRRSLYFNRWHVYRIGHTDGDQQWLATFRNKHDVDLFMKACGYTARPSPEQENGR